MGCYWIDILATSCSHSLVSTLNSADFIFGVSYDPLVLTFIRALRNPTFQQDNARPHVADVVRTFLDTENVRTLLRLSFANTKRLVHDCRATGFSPYASVYG
ncbi:hypothetical protein TNCV_285801 [Trichonephila clavipes]|nr:hypothetical protein TNCV_285801 [Trichonephila clavipes]